MNIHFLGTGGYHPNERRHTSCLLIPEVGVMLDAGTGLFRVAGRLILPTLDIFLTHAHLDHVVGLTYLFTIAARHRLEEIRVYATADKCRAIDEHLLSPLLFPARLPLKLVPLNGPIELSARVKVDFFDLNHPGGSVGFRLDWPDRSMAYVTDAVADPSSPYVSAIRGVDLLVHECFVTDEEADFAVRTGHSWPMAVARTAAAANASRLVLTHANPAVERIRPDWLDKAKDVFPAIIAAEDGLIVEL